MSYPFNFNDKVSTILAQICSYDGCLPQGAPSSLVLSNYICHRLDNQLLKLSRKCRIAYTRYADDITFSTNLKVLPSEIGIIKDNTLLLSSKLVNIIEDNGFTVNKEKIRFALKNNRQKVTSLIVNERINLNRKYIRHVRAMIHAWEKFGLEQAAIEHFEKYNYKNKIVDNYILSFIKELFGKIGYIGHIKGKENSVCRNIYKRVMALDSEIRIRISIPKEIIDSDIPIIFCEGKTDGMHLSSALSYFKHRGEFIDLNIYFFQYRKNEQINNDRLLKVCENRNLHKRSNRIEIYLFDRDVPTINNKVSESPLLYKNWGKKIYSLLLPILPHRSFEEICIEQYYTDDEIKIKTKNGFRIYLSNEFDQKTGKHLNEAGVLYTHLPYLKNPFPRILDSGLIKHSNNQNIALPKIAFAKNFSNGTGDFKSISFEDFKIILEATSKILKEAITT